MTAFDPADWLSRFVAADGWYIATGDGRLLAGWALEGREGEAREVWREIEHSPERREAIR